jgi:hypothetical protein
MKTWRRWEADGKIQVEWTPGGHRRYDLASLRGWSRQEPEPSERMTLAYVRVSTADGTPLQEDALWAAGCDRNLHQRRLGSGGPAPSRRSTSAGPATCSWSGASTGLAGPSMSGITFVDGHCLTVSDAQQTRSGAPRLEAPPLHRQRRLRGHGPRPLQFLRRRRHDGVVDQPRLVRVGREQTRARPRVEAAR